MPIWSDAAGKVTDRVLQETAYGREGLRCAQVTILVFWLMCIKSDLDRGLTCKTDRSISLWLKRVCKIWNGLEVGA